MVRTDAALKLLVGILGVASSIIFFLLRSFWLVTILQVLVLLINLLFLGWALSGTAQAKVAHYFYNEHDDKDSRAFSRAAWRGLAVSAVVVTFGTAVIITLALLSTKVTRHYSWIPALPAVVTAFGLIIFLPLCLVSVWILICLSTRGRAWYVPIVILITFAALWMGLHILLESPLVDALLWLVVMLLMSLALALVSSSQLRKNAKRSTIAVATFATLAAIAITIVLCMSYSAMPSTQPPTAKIESPIVMEEGLFTPVHVQYGNPDAGLVSAPTSEKFIVRERVDMSPLLTTTSFRSKVAEWYWGYTLSTLPVYGSMYYPTSNTTARGPLPVFVMIHGNALPELRSLEGYEPLLFNLASHGFIAISIGIEYLGTGIVDFLEATLVGGLFEGTRRDYAMRAAMAFRHLQLLKAWNETQGHPLRGLV